MQVKHDGCRSPRTCHVLSVAGLSYTRDIFSTQFSCGASEVMEYADRNEQRALRCASCHTISKVAEGYECPACGSLCTELVQSDT